MTRINNTDKQWRLQARKTRAHKWVNKGLFETRANARQEARYMRDCVVSGYGFGNVRVIPYLKAVK